MRINLPQPLLIKEGSSNFMPKPRDKKNNIGDSGGEKIKITERKSSVSEFVKRSLPTEEEAEKFDEYAHEEAKSGDIEESLSEIYQDESGKMVDVRKLEIKKGRGVLFWFFIMLTTVIVAGAAYFGYLFFFQQSFSGNQVQFSINGKEEVLAGEDFFYSVSYKNLSNVAINNIEITLTYPENFIFAESVPQSQATSSNFWRLGKLEAHRSGEIKIKGKIIALQGETGNIFGEMSYRQENFSSEFKKEAAFESAVNGIGIGFIFESSSGILVGEESEIAVKYKKEDNNYLNNFRLSAVLPDNMEFIQGEDKNALPGVWKVEEIKDEEQEIKIKFKAKDKKNETEEIILNFESTPDGNKYYKFKEEKVSVEVIKNGLNLNLILNGSTSDRGIDFGETLNYSIAYANKGETEMKDVVIMAVLTSDILDWQSLSDKNNGKTGNNAISWSKEEIPQLESIELGAEGIIDFSINVLPLGEINSASVSKYEVESYAQFAIGNIEIKQNEDTKSNTILSKVNSDLKLNEEVRYFSEDNIAVGSGPLPPKVGQMTSYKIYWNLTNNLHELNNLRLEAALPDYVSWNDKNQTTVGTIYYNESNRKVIWEIGRLPVSVYEANAEFNISITPAESDRNKVLVLMPGTNVQATDSETNSTISKVGKAKTTKLEDDPIAVGDGRVE